MTDPLTTLDTATLYYHEDGGQVRTDDATVAIYPHWVHVTAPTGNWIPREQVEQIHEF